MIKRLIYRLVEKDTNNKLFSKFDNT